MNFYQRRAHPPLAARTDSEEDPVVPRPCPAPLINLARTRAWLRPRAQPAARPQPQLGPAPREAQAEEPQPSPVSHLQDGGGSFNLTSREEFVPLSLISPEVRGQPQMVYDL
ncbi:uncharacterized protein LOC121011540 isoform X1 [Herpailurus yagouaroundi]|uniref:uncharacterized protein LOC121011540 isoform X1 n=1 Tax=Herpailurus yagouaroundi TaxID=1608482 RepID=UPI001AD64A3D|nr:uncharacterized protein LOC121011540 isoform X1 [Puma yagouaroundi]